MFKLYSISQRSNGGQRLKQIISHHKSDSRLGKRSCSLTIPFQELDYQFNYQEVSILANESIYTKKLFLEMSLISKTKYCIDFKTDIEQLSNILSYFTTIVTLCLCI